VLIYCTIVIKKIQVNTLQSYLSAWILTQTLVTRRTMKFKAPPLYTGIKSPLFISLLLFILSMAGTEFAIKQYVKNQQIKQSIHAEEISDIIHSALLASINDTFHLYGLRAYLIATQGKIRPDELNAILANYFLQIGNDQVIRNINVAPDNQIQYIFPLTGNEKARGLRLIDLPKQWPMIERAMQEQQPVLIGPVELVQDVLGLIYTVPVFMTENNYWGSISIVLNVNNIFGLINEKITHAQVQVALRGRNGAGEKGEVFWGDATLFDGEGVRSTIKVPGGFWQLVVKPDAIDTMPLSIAHLTGLLLSSLLAMLLFIALTASRQRIKNADQFSKIASQLPGMVFQFCLRTDGSYCFPFVSEGIRDLYRLSPEDVRDDASKLFALFHPDELGDINAAIQKAAQELSTFNHEFRVQYDDGTVCWHLGKSVPQREADGSTLWYGFTTDITERKLLEEKLCAKRELLNSIIDSTPSSIFAVDLQGRFILVNKAVSEFYRMRKEDLLGKTLHEVFPKDIADNKMTTNNQVLITGKRLDFEEHILTDFESLSRTLMVTKFPIQSASGEQLYGIGGVATDITELRQAKEAIEATAQYARSLIEVSLDPLVTISSEGKIADVNRATERVTGLDRKQLIGSDFADYFTDAKKAREGYQLVFSNGFVTDYPLAIKHVTGKVTDVLYNASVYRDDKGRVLGVFAAARDITDRKLIEHALHESEFLWKFAIEGSGDGVWDWNIQTDQVVYSRLLKEMIGYTEDEILPVKQEWFDRVHPDDQLHVAEVLQAYLDGKTEIYVAEYRLRCKDESYKWILGRGMVVDFAEEGTPLRMIGTHTDISKRKYQEQQDKEHLNQLAHVTRLGLMGEMASGIAHEVNQPLTAIATYTQVSLNLMKAECPDLIKLTEIIYKTQQQALRAGQIIRRMREFVKANTKQVSEADLNELIQDAVGLCLPELKLGNIALTLQLQSPLPLINVDRIQIEQVIINLIRNSADAFDSCLENQQKEISIHSLLTLNEGIEVRVKDNGSGITEDQQQKILMPFYTTKAEGMGMGLSICSSIIDAHEGHLKFNSQVGKGTTFYFTLPIKYP